MENNKRDNKKKLIIKYLKTLDKIQELEIDIIEIKLNNNEKINLKSEILEEYLGKKFKSEFYTYDKYLETLINKLID